MLSARALQIASADDPRHWKWTSVPESRFTEVAKLRSIERLEIRGVIPAQMLSPNTKYASWLIYSMEYGFCRRDYPAKASVKFVKEDGTVIVEQTIRIYLELPYKRFKAEGRCNYMDIDGMTSWLFEDWYGIELGESFIGEGARYDVHIEITETNLNRKKGLVIEGIELKPRNGLPLPGMSVLRI